MSQAELCSGVTFKLATLNIITETLYLRNLEQKLEIEIEDLKVEEFAVKIIPTSLLMYDPETTVFFLTIIENCIVQSISCLVFSSSMF